MVRPLLFGTVGTVAGRVRGDEAAVRAADWAETLLTPEYFARAPFHTVGLVLLIGADTDLDTKFRPRRRDELPVAIQVALDKLRNLRGAELDNAFRYIILKALIDVAAKYQLPRERLDQEMARLHIPEL